MTSYIQKIILINWKRNTKWLPHNYYLVLVGNHKLKLTVLWKQRSELQTKYTLMCFYNIRFYRVSFSIINTRNCGTLACCEGHENTDTLWPFETTMQVAGQVSLFTCAVLKYSHSTNTVKVQITTLSLIYMEFIALSV